jgi:hypothetical protein
MRCDLSTSAYVFRHCHSGEAKNLGLENDVTGLIRSAAQHGCVLE